jgi:signal transduction histidine kinase
MPLISTLGKTRVEFLPAVNLTATTLAISAEMVFLLSYLSWPWLRRQLGRFYLPLGLTIALAGLIFEQHLISPRSSIWQPTPFLYILVIFVAWQYGFREVVIFTLAAALFEIALTGLMPQQDVFPQRFAEFNQVVAYGRLASRTASFLILGYVVTRLMKAQREQRRIVAEANQKLIRHAATLEQLTISRERNRISRELHDTLAHTLSALTVQLDAITAVWDPIPAKIRSMLEQMLSTTRSGLEETRRALRSLRASQLEEMGLALAVSALAEDIASRSDMTLELDVPDNMDDVPPEVEQCFFRVAQEALENAARHANAHKLSVHISQDSERMTLTVSDDGRGFNSRSEKAGEHHFGLRGLRERAELIGAELSVESQTGQGTTIHLNLGRGP